MSKILITNNKKHKQLVVVGNMLKQLGFNIVYSQTAQETINIIKDNNQKIDLLICNIFLEDMSGFELSKNIRSIEQNLPILFVSQQITPELINQLYSSGASDFIAIPCLKVELMNRVNNLLKIASYKEQVEEFQNKIDSHLQVLQSNAHDAKNPLSSIFSLSGMPATVFTSTEEMQQMLDIVHDASKIVINLINEALDYFKLSNNEVQFEMLPLDILSVLNQVVEINSPLAKVKKQTINFSYDNNAEYLVLADNLKIFRAINNIVGNAIKFSPLGKNIWINISRKNSDIIIQVKDEGPGFKQEELAKVFKENQKFSAKPTGGEISTGLGLMIVKFILDKHNAQIIVTSEEGKGSVFTMYFKPYKKK